MSTRIEVAGSLIPGVTDTPLDARGRIASLDDVGNIENPFVGMPFYVASERALFVVRTLKSKQVGSITVPNAAIDQYGPAVGIPDKLLLIRPNHDKPLWPVVYAYPDRSLAEADKATVCDGANYGNVSVWNGKVWEAADENGIPDFCKNLPVEIITSALRIRSGYFVYYWIDGEGYQSDAISMPFPVIAEPTPFHLHAICGSDGGMTAKMVTAAEYAALLEPDPLTLYFVQGVGLMFGGEKYYSQQGGTE